VSLSLYHDEDFGMSPAEAALCGLPLVLTDWGGYAGFRDYSLACDLVPVRIERGTLRIDSDAIQSRLALRLEKVCSAKERETLAAHAQNYLSVPAATEILRGVLTRSPGPFPGFAESLNRFKELFRANYEEIYSAYVR